MSINLHPSKDGDFQVQFLLHHVEFFLELFDTVVANAYLQQIVIQLTVVI